MSDETETEIEVQIDQADEPVVETKTEAASADVSEVIKAQAKEYEAKLDAERREKEEARRRAETAEREVKVATAKVAESELDAVSNAIHAVEMERESVKQQLKTAMEAGDFDGTVKAQEALAETITKLNALKEGKTYIESRKAEPSDPQEAYIRRFTPRSQEYLRSHRELISDPTKNKRMIAAHYEAEAEGYAPDTEAYFRFLDKKLGYAEPETKAAPAASKPSRMPAAPISRGDGGDYSSGGGPAVVKLTPGEARAATDGSIIWNAGPNRGEPIGVKEYARRKSIMMKQGQYSNEMQ
jgi:hypothetical protein